MESGKKDSAKRPHPFIYSAIAGSLMKTEKKAHHKPGPRGKRGGVGDEGTFSS